MLNSPTCKVRHIGAADLETYIARLNDLPSRGEHVSCVVQSPEAIRREFAANGLCTEQRERFIIEDKRGHLVGTISHFASRTTLCREIGYRLFDTELAGRGVITSAVGMLCDYLFRAYPLTRLELLMNVGNDASERIAQKLGFTCEGTLRQMFFTAGQIHDVKIYSLLRREWQARDQTRM